MSKYPINLILFFNILTRLHFISIQTLTLTELIYTWQILKSKYLCIKAKESCNIHGTYGVLDIVLGFQLRYLI